MKFVTGICLILLSLLHVEAAAQAGKVDARKVLLDDGWKFKLGDEPQAMGGDYSDAGWRVLDLPHDWSVEGNFDARHPMGNDGGYLPAGIGWYRKTVKLSPTQKGKAISLYFEGVYMQAEVYVNGVKAGGRPYGYSSFTCDISKLVRFDQVNTIAVRVDNSQQKNCRWYSGSGIYRHVWLVTTDRVHLDPWGIAITTPQATTATATVQVATTIVNEMASEQKVVLTTTLFDQQGKRVGVKEQSVVLPAQSTQPVMQSLEVAKPALWAPGHPALYKAQVSIAGNNKQVDRLQVPFGIRTIQYNAAQGLRLNGETIKLNGGCVHHDNGILGAAAYDQAEIRKVRLLKQAGFNAVRTSHNPPSEAFLDACDSLGLIVIDESFDGWRTKKTPYDYALYFDAWWEKDIESMVLRDINHPSILFWSTGNEIIERKEPEAVVTATKLAGLVRKLDPTRPVLSAITTWDREWERYDTLFAAHDIGGYNYQLHRAEADHARVPSRVIVQTESYPRDAFSNWKLVSKHPYIIGDFVWTAMDYLGESGIGRYFYKGETEGQHYERDIYPWHGAYCGDIDLVGWRKPISHYRDLLYNEDKKIYLAVKEPSGYWGEIKETMWSVWPTWESWTWPGHDNKNIEVEVYSRYPAVRLYLNDQLVGEKAVSVQTEFKAVFPMPYQPGKLRAVGVVNGKEMDPQVLQTADAAAGMKTTADKLQLKADGQDLTFVTVDILDAAGIAQPNADNVLTFSIEGPVTIVAVGNANLADTDSYVGHQHKAWKGKALVVLKGKRQKGPATLTINSPGLKPATVRVQVK